VTTLFPLPESALASLVDRFYARVRQDELIGPVFNEAIGDHWPEHLARITAFWSSLLCGSGQYKGNPVAVHLELPRLTRLHLDRWLELWARTTNEMLPPAEALMLQQKASRIGSRILETVDEQHAIR
jgi:hemoglobin